MNRRLDQQGAVSLISVAIFAIIITVITTLYIRTVVTQQRNALNYDYSNRAFYASLAGFEDTKRAIDAGQVVPDAQNKKSTCGVLPSGAGQLSAKIPSLAYTCQLVNFSPSTLSLSEVPANSSAVFPVRSTAASGNYRLRVTWQGGTGTRTDDKSLPTQGYWETAGYPSMLRAQVVVFGNGTLQRSAIKSRSLYLNPSNAAENSATGNVSRTFTISDYLNWNLPPNEPIINAQCTAGESGICEATLNFNSVDFQNQNVMIVLKPLYVNARNVTIGLVDTNGNTVNFSGGQAVIDITGKSGEVFKRTQQSYPYGKYQVGLTNLPDYAIIGGEGICKQMKLRLDSSRYEEECTPDSP